MISTKTISTDFGRLIATGMAILIIPINGSLAVGQTTSSPSTVLDRLWIWTHPVGVHDGIDLGAGCTGKSRMTPVQGAACLGLPNIYFIHFPNKPPVSEFGQYAMDFRPMKRVVWSLTGAGGDTSSEGRETVLKLATEFPNIAGFVLDDFLHLEHRFPARSVVCGQRRSISRQSGTQAPSTRGRPSDRTRADELAIRGLPVKRVRR